MILAKTNRVSVRSRPWLRLVAINDQPCFVNDERKQRAEETIQKKENEIKERYEQIKTGIEKKN